MLTRVIPSTGEALPVIGVGTWDRFDVGAKDPKRTQLRQVLAELRAAGGSVIDSSPMYGKSEGVVGDLLAELPPEPRYFLATKVWTQGREQGIAEMDRSFERMRTQRMDLMQVHNLLDWQVHLKTIQAWKEAGRIRYLGITHYTASAHAELESVMRAAPWDFVQLNYSLEEPAAERRLLPLAAERGIAVIVNRPFGGGGLIRRLHKKPLPGWALEAGWRSWAELLLKFILAHPAVTCVIPGTGDPGHMREILCAVEGEPLDGETSRRLSALIED